MPKAGVPPKGDEDPNAGFDAPPNPPPNPPPEEPDDPKGAGDGPPKGLGFDDAGAPKAVFPAPGAGAPKGLGFVEAEDDAPPKPPPNPPPELLADDPNIPPEGAGAGPPKGLGFDEAGVPKAVFPALGAGAPKGLGFEEAPKAVFPEEAGAPNGEVMLLVDDGFPNGVLLDVPPNGPPEEKGEGLPKEAF